MRQDKLVLSANQVAMYASCARRYAFRFVHELEPDERSASAAFVRTMRSTLEALHEARLAGENHPTAAAFVRILNADWQSELDQGLSFKSDESANLLRWTGEQLLGRYFTFIANNRPLATDQPYEIDLVDPETGEVTDVRLRGSFDLVFKDDVLAEVKVVPRPYSPSKLAQRLQLSAYAYAWRMTKRRDPKVSAITLLRQQHPALEQSIATRTNEDDAFFFHVAVETAEAIRRGSFPPNVGFVCEDCEFKQTCRRWRGERAFPRVDGDELVTLRGPRTSVEGRQIETRQSRSPVSRSMNSRES